MNFADKILYKYAKERRVIGLDYKKAYVGKSLGEEFEQKEQKPLSTEETELNSLAFLEQLGYTCIPPKKEYQNNANTPNENSWRGNNSSSHKDKNLDEIAQDYVEGVKECNQEPTWDLIQTAVCYGYHLAEQKPAEWSEGDEEMLIGIIERGSAQIPPHEPALREEQMEWLMNRLKSLRPQPKAEWMDEDEQHLKWLCRIIHSRKNHGELSLAEESDLCNWIDKWINHNLQPHWKPSKEQMDALENAWLECDSKETSVVLSSLMSDLQKLL